jgi:hypothetical protein
LGGWNESAPLAKLKIKNKKGDHKLNEIMKTTPYNNVA